MRTHIDTKFAPDFRPGLRPGVRPVTRDFQAELEDFCREADVSREPDHAIYYDPRYDDESEAPYRAAKGILNGVLISLLFWLMAAIILIVAWW